MGGGVYFCRRLAELSPHRGGCGRVHLPLNAETATLSICLLLLLGKCHVSFGSFCRSHRRPPPRCPRRCLCWRCWHHLQEEEEGEEEKEWVDAKMSLNCSWAYQVYLDPSPLPSSMSMSTTTTTQSSVCSFCALLPPPSLLLCFMSVCSGSIKSLYSTPLLPVLPLLPLLLSQNDDNHIWNDIVCQAQDMPGQCVPPPLCTARVVPL